MTDAAPATTPPPGPRMPAALQALWLFRDPIGLLEQCTRRFGPIFRLDLPGWAPLAYLTSPELARELYAAHGPRAGDARRPFLSPLVGEHSLLCLEDEPWARQRRLLAPALHGERVLAWRDRIAAIADAAVGEWPTGTPVALRPHLQEVTLEVIMRLVFGLTDGPRYDRLRVLLPALLDAVANPIVFGLPTLRERLERSALATRVPGSPLRRFTRLRAEVHALLAEQISERRARTGEAGEPDDVLAALLAARDEDGTPMADAEIRDELLTLLTAGHETTATALAWSFERLARHPDVGARLVSELDAGGAEQPYLEAVVKEVLRARPIVFDTPRTLDAPLAIGGHTLPAGWMVAPAIPLVQRDERRFPDPDRFDPERFLVDHQPVQAWIPFGGGARRCVGSRLALLELHTIITAVLTRRTVEPVDPAPEAQRVAHVTLTPEHGARVVLHAR